MPPRHRKFQPSDDSQLELGLVGESARPKERPAGPPETNAFTAGPSRRIFLGWEEPLLATVSRFLCAGALPGTGPVDLSALLIIVPTKHAGRRLREALAIRAAERNTAVLPPRVVTPDFLVNPERLEGKRPASPAEMCAVLMSALLEVDLNHYREVFPVDPVERNADWALRTADELNRARSLLGEGGHTFASALPLLAGEGLEADRWRELARLEQELQRRLRACGLDDPQELRRSLVKAPPELPGTSRVVLAGLSDPIPCMVTALEQLIALGMRCDILIQAPEALAPLFDWWGRPLTTEWLNREIPIDLGSIHLAANPQEQANLALTRMKPYGNQAPRMVAVGIPDPETIKPFSEALLDLQLNAFDPAGKSLKSHWLTYLLRRLGQLIAVDSFEAALSLLHCPEVIAAAASQVEAQTGQRPSPTGILVSLDKLAQEHLPGSLGEALEFAGRAPRGRRADAPETAKALHLTLDWLDRQCRLLRRKPLVEGLPEFLAMLFGDRLLDSTNAADEEFADVLGLFTGSLESLNVPAFEPLRPLIEAADELDLLLHLLDREAWVPDRRADDIDLLGWLELPWEDAPHLIITGMNEGLVPESIYGHAFLPDSARKFLGLRHNDTRGARDAFLLSALVASRKKSGRVDLIFGRTSSTGDPLRPSRLLLACPETELPSRVSALFQDPPAAKLPPPWTRTWQLTPPSPDPDLRIFQSIQVTAFRDYLGCPLQFYLKKGLGMNKPQDSKDELDWLQFGNLIHHALETYGTNLEMRECEDEASIAECLLDTLDSQVTAIYGRRLTAPLLVQRESARQRLRWWAACEADNRREGWRILEVECPLGSDEQPWMIGGLPVHGRIDRIEEHQNGDLRVLDFKTGKTAVRENHIGSIREGAHVPEWARTTALKGNRPGRWTDLQIPLYVLAWQQRHPGRQILGGYGLLGESKAGVKLDLWDDLDVERLTEALTCAEGVVAAILARQFWPPSPYLKYDDFREVFFSNALEAVNPCHLLPATP